MEDVEAMNLTVLESARELLPEIREVHSDTSIAGSSLEVDCQDYVWKYRVKDSGDWQGLSLPMSMRLSYPYREGPEVTKLKPIPGKRALLEGPLRWIGKAGFGLCDAQLTEWLFPIVEKDDEGNFQINSIGEVCSVAGVVASMLCDDNWLNTFKNMEETWERLRGEQYQEKAARAYSENNHLVSSRDLGKPFDAWLCNALVGSYRLADLDAPKINGLRSGLICAVTYYSGNCLHIKNVALCCCNTCEKDGSTPIGFDNRCARGETANIKTAGNPLTINRGLFSGDDIQGGFIVQCTRPGCNCLMQVPADAIVPSSVICFGDKIVLTHDFQRLVALIVQGNISPGQTKDGQAFAQRVERILSNPAVRNKIANGIQATSNVPPQLICRACQHSANLDYPFWNKRMASYVRAPKNVDLSKIDRSDATASRKANEQFLRENQDISQSSNSLAMRGAFLEPIFYESECIPDND